MKKVQGAPTTMEIIRAGLFKSHPAGSADHEFVDAIYSLYNEFVDAYQTEWERLDDNERVYQNKHWDSEVEDGTQDANKPKPAMPILTSAIEYKKSDLADELPEAVIHPDAFGSEVSAKVLTRVVNQELAACKFEREWNLTSQDYLASGWVPWEIGFDPDMNQGNGGGYIRYLVNKNFMCDPEVADLQDGRACFKMARRPFDWFAQRFPKHAPFLTRDSDLDDAHDTFDSSLTLTNLAGRYRLIEAWFRVYNPETRKSAVHFVLVSGGQVLYNSAEKYPDGYYAHGQYPFVIARLFPDKGSALGFGLIDIFKDAQKYYDKLDQIVLSNALLASRNRIYVAESAGFDISKLSDWSREIQEGQDINGVKWETTPPLPSYILGYMDMKAGLIKQDSGTNDQSRGQTGNGVTAGSAITALQDMATKRSRMEANMLHYAFCDAVRMLLDILREFNTMKRDVTVTLGGVPMQFEFSNTTIKPKRLQGQPINQMVDKDTYMSLVDNLNASTSSDLPVEYYVDVKSARQTRFQKLQNNELILQFMQLSQGTADLVVMAEAMEFDEKEMVLEALRKAQAGGMNKLQQQNAQLTEMVAQMQEQLKAYKGAAEEAQAYMQAQARQQQQQQQQASVPKGMARNME